MLTRQNATDHKLVHQHFLFTSDHSDSKRQVNILLLSYNLLCQKSGHRKNSCSCKTIQSLTIQMENKATKKITIMSFHTVLFLKPKSDHFKILVKIHAFN